MSSAAPASRQTPPEQSRPLREPQGDGAFLLGDIIVITLVMAPYVPIVAGCASSTRLASVSNVEPSPDGETSFAHLDIQLGGDEGGDGEQQAEWGGFGFMFVLAALSFNDARPRGYSDEDFIEKDEFGVADFFDGLTFCRGELHYHGDYIRGRCVKTEIVVRRDGLVTLETRGRGESALRWVERLKGKKIMELVP